jgi:hypothetical protein
MHFSKSWIVTSAATLLLGCSGVVSGGGPAPGDPGAQPPGTQPPGTQPPGTQPPGTQPPAPGDAPGTTPLRRLTNLEYRNTLRDLLGATPGTLAKDIGDSFLSGFARGATVSTGVDARQFLESSEAIAAAAIKKLPDLVPCKTIPTDAAAQDDCARQFVTSFGLRAFRRPVAPEESTELFKLYTAQRAGGQFADGIEAVLAAILQSPYFLYRREVGPKPVRDGALVRFDSYEVASRLSYFLWASMPDDQLFTAAGKNELASPAQITAQARRMMADPKFKDAIRDFHLQWMNVDDVVGLQKDPSFKEFTPAVAQSMLDETAEFANHLLWGPQATGRLDALLTSSTSYIDPGLAAVYGATGVTGTGLRAVALDPRQRAGILTQASFLASHANPDSDHPVRRGVDIIRHLFCVDIQVPTNIEVPPVKDKLPDQTTRDQFLAHATTPQCAACHQMIDPLGFAFEHYDAIGKWRDLDGKKPVDSTGAVMVSGANLKFADAVDLSKQLAQLDQVRQCMAAEWLRYLLRRREGDGDAASLRAALDAFRAASFDLREVIVSLTGTRSFTHRSPSDGEAL